MESSSIVFNQRNACQAAKLLKKGQEFALVVIVQKRNISLRLYSGYLEYIVYTYLYTLKKTQLGVTPESLQDFKIGKFDLIWYFVSI